MFSRRGLNGASEEEDVYVSSGYMDPSSFVSQLKVRVRKLKPDFLFRGLKMGTLWKSEHETLNEEELENITFQTKSLCRTMFLCHLAGLVEGSKCFELFLLRVFKFRFQTCCLVCLILLFPKSRSLIPMFCQTDNKRRGYFLPPYV